MPSLGSATTCGLLAHSLRLPSGHRRASAQGAGQPNSNWNPGLAIQDFPFTTIPAFCAGLSGSIAEPPPSSLSKNRRTAGFSPPLGLELSDLCQTGPMPRPAPAFRPASSGPASSTTKLTPAEGRRAANNRPDRVLRLPAAPGARPSPCRCEATHRQAARKACKAALLKGTMPALVAHKWPPAPARQLIGPAAAEPLSRQVATNNGKQHKNRPLPPGARWPECSGGQIRGPAAQRGEEQAPRCAEQGPLRPAAKPIRGYGRRWPGAAAAGVRCLKATTTTAREIRVRPSHWAWGGHSAEKQHQPNAV